MAAAGEKIYVFEEFCLEPETRMLIRRQNCGSGGEIKIRLANRPFRVLRYLIENRERIVSRRELLEKFWDGREVYDEAVTKCVGAIRRALDEPSKHASPRFIETRWAGGYRFIGNVQEICAPSYLEIEKSREVKIIIEESDDDLSLSAKQPEVFSASGLQTMRRSGFVFPRQRFIIFAFCLVLALAVSGFVFFRNDVRPNQSIPDSIAVLPLRNLSHDPEGEIFSDGMTESLIGSLSKIKGLKVISRNSSAAFKNKDAAPQEIAERLGVKTFIEGSVRESAGRIRVEVRLVNAESGEILWSGDAYERPLGDVFQIQDEIARSVAMRLKLKLTQTDEQQLSRRQTSSTEAYQCYVKGRYFWKKKDRQSLEKAREFFEEAVRLDSNYALAYAGLADYYLSGVWYSNLPPGEAAKNAKAMVAKLSELDAQMSEAYKLRSIIAGIEWDWENSRRESKMAVEMNSNEANNWHAYAFVLRNLDARFDEAVTAIKRAQELDPLSPSVNTDVGVMLAHAGRLDEAIAEFKKTLEAEPDFADAYWNLGIAYERKGMDAEAFAAFIESDLFLGKNEQRSAAYRAAFTRGGLKLFWKKVLEFVVAEAKKRSVPDYFLAVFYARAGEPENTFRQLEKSYAAREPYLMNLKTDFAFDGLRDDPRLKDLLRRIGLDN